MTTKFLKLSFVLIAFVSLFSCQTESIDEGLLDNNDDILEQTLFQVRINGFLYSTNNAYAEVENGILTVTATKGDETFVLKSQGALIGTYEDSNVDLRFSQQDPLAVYSSISHSGFVPGASLSVTEINFEDLIISGLFQFEGVNLLDTSENPENKSFVDGYFVNIPVIQD